ncbi:BMP family ABC transporter substrate-binding protein [Cohnella abietis]|uniref:BMP family ABC transporter substrate-binding protein n=1 Tax=Cohnella abietis TaxID=2507935 RepID=A0A3T1DE46_9BACL|nr:BMP family ABC transporter substrate-binding protein [Cohnella abietis]BBI36431.1 BMP family ABC transporter substrate-binding protein [Cohnella abietis]
MKMKKLSVLGVVILSFALILAACGKSNNNSASPSTSSSPSETSSASETPVTPSGEPISAIYFVNSMLGDKSFFDSAQAGIQKAVKELGIKAKTVEGGSNAADWAASLESLVSSGNYNVVVVGTSQMSDITKDLAARYPKVNFIFFDEVIEGVPNVYSMLYSQSEGSFLAGAFAALATTSTELKGANPEKVIGFVGGMDIPIINDFKSGYEQGAHYVDKDVKVVASYIGDFVNAPKGKEIGLAQINSQKADIVFSVASAAGLGTLEGANEKGVYSIGVDANQNPLYPGSVLTSMLKNVDQSIFRAIELLQKGELKLGTNEVLGMKEGGVGLAKDELYEKYVPQSIRDKMKEIEDKLSTGDITVKSSL